MKIVLRKHALDRMALRLVTRTQVAEVLLAYETDLPARFGFRNRYKKIGNRRIRVTFREIAPTTYLVSTVTVEEVD